MLTDALVSSLVSLAGPDFLYTGVRGCGRPSAKGMGKGSPRVGLRAYLWSAQGGLCVHCGEAVALEDAHTAHVVSRGPEVRGFLPGNLMVTHGKCNAEQRDEIGPVVKPEHLARPDLVVTEWPVRTVTGFGAYDPR